LDELSVQEGAVVGGEFRIVEPLGNGGMGAVYVAEQLSTGKLRALKMMHARLSDDAKQRERFTQEARVAASVESDHVVEIIGAGVNDETGIPWIAMELLEGEDLSAYLKRIGPLTTGAASTILEQLCHGLGAAHDAGIVHRDLKPHNVFVTQSRSTDARRLVKVLDFGIAKLMADSTLSTTAALGSPAWMAPEQTEASPLISPASDVWPLGLLTFWMLTGRSFWRAANSRDGSVQAVLREMVIDKIPRGSDRAHEIGCDALWPAMLDPWLARCVHRDPRRRFANARAAHEGFVAVLDGEPLPDLDDDVPETAATRRGAAVESAQADVDEPPTRRPHEPLHLQPTEPSSAGMDDPAVDSRDERLSAKTIASTTDPSTSVEERSTAISAGGDIDRTASPLTRTDSERPTQGARRSFTRALTLGVLATAVVGIGVALSLNGEEGGTLSAVDRPTEATSNQLPTPSVPDPSPTVDTEATRADTDPAPPQDAESADPRSTIAPPSPRSAVSARPRRSTSRAAGGDQLAPFNHAAARSKIASAQNHAASACKDLDGPRQFSATLIYDPRGALNINGSFEGASGACVKAALGMARMGEFGPDGAKSQRLPAAVTLQPSG
jgi:serine/threonine protein kinase